MIVNAGANSTDEQIALLVNAINDNLTELRTDIQAQIDQLSNAVNGATFNAVKSIQRGVYESEEIDEDIVININTINPDKAFVLLDAPYLVGDSATSIPTLKSLTATQLIVTKSQYFSSGWHPSRVSWQVIEFY